MRVAASREQEVWAAVPTSIASDCLGRFGAMAGIRPLSGSRLVGRAHTLRVVAGDNRAIHHELASVQVGGVLVIDAGGYVDRAVWGGVLTEAAIHRNLAGVVIDGAIRDVEEIRRTGFPVYARGTTPAGPHKAGLGSGGRTISCGGVPVSQNDLVLGDGDGVVVVPQSDVTSILASAKARIRTERDWVKKIRSGIPSKHVLGLEEPNE